MKKKRTGTSPSERAVFCFRADVSCTDGDDSCDRNDELRSLTSARSQQNGTINTRIHGRELYFNCFQLAIFYQKP